MLRLFHGETYRKRDSASVLLPLDASLLGEFGTIYGLVVHHLYRDQYCLFKIWRQGYIILVLVRQPSFEHRSHHSGFTYVIFGWASTLMMRITRRSYDGSKPFDSN